VDAAVEALCAGGLAEDEGLLLAGQLDGHVRGVQRPLAALPTAQQRVHQEACPGRPPAHLGLDELLARRHAVPRCLELLRQVHDLDQADGHAQVDPGASSVAGAPVVAGEHEQRLHAADARRLEIALEELAGAGGVGIAGLCLRAEARGRVFHEPGRCQCLVSADGWEVGGIPHGQRQQRPHQVRLKRPVPDAQQQRRRVVEAPFVRAPQIAVLDLVRQQVERV
jgi:hypothetical protein